MKPIALVIIGVALLMLAPLMHQQDKTVKSTDIILKQTHRKLDKPNWKQAEMPVDFIWLKYVDH